MKKHAKLLVFLAAVLLILLLDQRFGWSVYLGNWDNLSFLSLLAQEKGARSISLGRRILRTETAAITSIAMCMLHMETSLGGEAE